MIKNKYLFSSQFLEYLKNQKISDEESFEGFVKTIRALNTSKGSKNQIDESSYANIISFLQFAYPNKLEAYNLKRGTKFSYLYDGFPLKRKVSCIYILSNQKELDHTISGYFPAFDLIHLLKKEKLEWGILTDGNVWRLYSTLSSLPYENYVEIDFSDNSEDNYKVFWQLFTLHLFIPDENDVTQLEKYIDESEKEAKVIEDHIKNNIDEILENICFGFLSNSGKDKQPLSEYEKELYFENAVYLLFRMLFILYAESRELLPMDKPEYQRISFNGLLEKAKVWLSNGIPSPTSTELWDDFRDLTIHIEYGENTIGIPEYDGGLFDNRTRPFLTDPQNKLTNAYFVKVLHKIGYLSKKKTDIKIEYRDLSVRSIGSLYEGILEYKLFIADRDYVIRGKKIIPKSSAGIVKKSDREIPKGNVYFSQDAFERHDTGSYYTPEDVVNYMVQNSVRLGLEERWIDLLPNIKKYENELAKAVNEDAKIGLLKKLDRDVLKFVEDKILTFKVMDPAMGSGHFSVNSLNAITHFVIEVLQKRVLISDGPINHDKEIVEINWGVFNNEDSNINLNPVDWRRRIVEKCIFGIDINPLATELAKLSLWIASASKGKPLTFLDHHLKCGDSIMGVRLQDIMVYPTTVKQDKESNLWEHFDKSKIEEIGKKIQHLLSVDSEKVDNVYEKKEEYSQIEKEPYLNNLKDIATLWLMINFEVQKDGTVPLYLLDSAKYYELLDGASQYVEPHKWKEFIGASLKETIDSFARKKKVFHWELEFVELLQNGINAFIGNPPYVDVQQNYYSALKFLPLNSNNLYSYIVAKSFSFQSNDNVICFITPMSFISSPRMFNLRSFVLSHPQSHYFINIDSTSHPGTLFKNVNIQITIYFSKNTNEKTFKLYTTDYNRFYSSERKQLFKKIRITDIDLSLFKNNLIPKISYELEKVILAKLFAKTEKRINDFTCDNSEYEIFYKSAGNPYYRQAFDEIPFFEVNGENSVSSKIKTIHLCGDFSAPLLCLFHSSIFFWFYVVYSDCRDFTIEDLNRFPIDLEQLSSKNQFYKKLYQRIKLSLESNGKIVTYNKQSGITRYFEFKPRYSKPIFDEVDTLLSEYYGFSDEEYNFLINYDINYRTD